MKNGGSMKFIRFDKVVVNIAEIAYFYNSGDGGDVRVVFKTGMDELLLNGVTYEDFCTALSNAIHNRPSGGVLEYEDLLR